MVTLPATREKLEYLVLAGSGRSASEPGGKLQIVAVAQRLAARDGQLSEAGVNAREAALNVLRCKPGDDVHEGTACADGW